jgi:putative SOS response-associated peptidase YedK
MQRLPVISYVVAKVQFETWLQEMATASNRPDCSDDGQLAEGEVTCDLFAFLTTDANSELGAIHPKAMPVILTRPEEIETWLTAPSPETSHLKLPLPDSKLRIAARGQKQDAVLDDAA